MTARCTFSEGNLEAINSEFTCKAECELQALIGQLQSWVNVLCSLQQSIDMVVVSASSLIAISLCCIDAWVAMFICGTSHTIDTDATA